MDKELIKQLQETAKRNAKHLSEIENDPEFIEKVERYQRESKKNIDMKKVFDI